MRIWPLKEFIKAEQIEHLKTIAPKLLFIARGWKYARARNKIVPPSTGVLSTAQQKNLLGLGCAAHLQKINCVSQFFFLEGRSWAVFKCEWVMSSLQNFDPLVIWHTACQSHWSAYPHRHVTAFNVLGDSLRGWEWQGDRRKVDGVI